MLDLFSAAMEGSGKLAVVATLVLSSGFTIWYTDLTNHDTEVLQELKLIRQEIKTNAIDIAVMQEHVDDTEQKFGFVLRELFELNRKGQ